MASSMNPRHSTGPASDERDLAVISMLAAQSDCHHSETITSRPQTSDLRCCCGQADCVFLKHNNAQLHGLERNVQTAAQMGQALLIRHEIYMADAERQRHGMTEVIEKLEAGKRELETENAKTIEENRDLLSQLEELNNTVAETDDHVKSLTATLLSTQVELQRLTVLASRTAQLEAQLALLEEEQAQLQNTLIITKEDERSAIQRWKRAERALGDLQDQLDRVEQEARDERERHIEVVGRLERRRVVEKELESAAGRLKGAAAAKTLGKGKGGSSVVSHFVKDILQDNANLQMGIVELREMLLTSNEEVQTLREQLVMHQPTLEDTDGQRSATLRRELGVESSPMAPQEVHVHHHYHAPPHVQETTPKEKASPLRRPKKKRNVITPTLFNPPSLQNLRSPTYLKTSPGPSTAAAILSQTSVSIPPSATPTFPSKRSSIQSTQTRSSFAPSSVPSSPPSVFDRAFGSSVIDSSRPTSPESSEPCSPTFSPRQFNRGSDASYRSFSTPAGVNTTACVGLHPTWEEDDADAEYTDHDISHSNDQIYPEEDTDLSHAAANDNNITLVEPNISSDDDVPRPTLRRSASHESILSISALDIPATIRNRPSQVFLGKGAYSSPRTTLGIVSPTAALDTSKPVLTAMTATARPVSRKGWGYDSSTYNRYLLESRRGHHSRNPSYGDSTPDRAGPQKDQTLGRRVGGWVWGRWGISPESSSRGTKPNPILEERLPGVNQPGPIRGIFSGSAPDTDGGGKGKRKSVLVSEVDKELLRETLREQEA